MNVEHLVKFYFNTFVFKFHNKLNTLTHPLHMILNIRKQQETGGEKLDQHSFSSFFNLLILQLHWK